MSRNKSRVKVSHDGRLPSKRDTPLRVRLKSRRHLLIKSFKAIPEEPEMTVPTASSAFPVQTGMNPVNLKSALVKSPKTTAVLPAAPAHEIYGYRVLPTSRPTVQMTPKPEALNCVVTPVNKDLAVTPENITTSNTEFNTTLSCDDDEEDCFSSASPSSMSLSSPEIFRKDDYEDSLTLPIEEDLLGLHFNIKNSTLLDESHAQRIHMYPCPNLSNIIGASLMAAEKKLDISQPKGPEAETKHTNSLKSGIASIPKTPTRFTNRWQISYKKKVSFKSPIISEAFRPKSIPTDQVMVQHTTEQPQKSSSPEQIKPDATRPGEIRPEDKAPCLMVSLKRPFKSSPDKAKFFDFGNDRDTNAFLQMMRERSERLRRQHLIL